MSNTHAVHKLELQAIQKHYVQHTKVSEVIEHISLTAATGEFVSIIGPSGCGKSTLFHMIGGISEPTSGSIWLDGANVTGKKGMISYMPQQPALFPWRTIEHNVIMAQELAGIRKSSALAMARPWLQKAGLGGYEQAYPHMLSGGMQQRAAFLRALLSPSEVMCLDEPFGALDALTRMNMQRWLLDIWEENKRTVLFITHSIEEALFLSDKIILLSKKPTRVLETIHVPFARPRTEAIMMDPHFLKLKQAIYEQMISSPRKPIP